MRKSFPLREKPAVLLWLSIALLLPLAFLLTRWAWEHNKGVRAERKSGIDIEAPLRAELPARVG